MPSRGLIFSWPRVLEIFDRGNGLYSIWLFDWNFKIHRKVRWWARNR